jgi:hypothetical protein
MGNKSKQQRKAARTLALALLAATPVFSGQNTAFVCNAKALDSAERAHHQQLTAKIISARNKIVETPKGYEFQFMLPSVSLAELADWVAAEQKCCPFFDFHIDLEDNGRLLCLRLTGPGGIKPFIRAEFHVPAA